MLQHAQTAGDHAAQSWVSLQVSRLAALHAHGLPHRQQETLVLRALGFDDQEAAEILGIALSTVRNHGQQLRERFGAPRRPETRVAVSAWAWIQRRCCTASAFAGLVADYPDARERVAALAQAHRPQPPARGTWVLCLQALGLSDLDSARTLSLSEHTVQDHAQSVHASVVPPTLRPTRANAACWFFLHQRCCLPEFLPPPRLTGQNSLVG